MNHDYDEELKRGTERRSRRNPRMRDDSVSGSVKSERERWERRQQLQKEKEKEELDILGDAAVHPIPVEQRPVNDNLKDARHQSVSGRELPARKLPENQNQASERGKKKRRRMITMIIAEVFALIFIFGYGFFVRTISKLQRDDTFEIGELKTNDIDVQAAEMMKGYWTIAVFGVDSRDNTVKKSTNADVNIICNINRDTGEIRLVSVYRDSYLNISENGSYNKINQAYFMGGPEQAVQALNRNLDLQIQDYMSFNWKAVANAIDILGGVDVELSKAEFYYINSFITETVKATGIGSHQLTHAGMNHLDGVQSVAYGRLRLMDTDYARTERQRKIIALAFEKAKKADFQTLYRVIGTVFPQVSTSIWVDDLVSNAKNIGKFHLGETTGFPQARGDANMGKKGACVIPQTLETNVTKLHEFLFGIENYKPSETVKKISAKISADTGMYKEGQYVDKVSTEGGVIQPPKTSAAAEESSTASSEEDGDYIIRETDEDGIETEPGDMVYARPPVFETDEFGDLIETESESAPLTSLESTTADRPGTTAETTTASRPGTTAETTTASRPGAVTETTAASRPGGTTSTTAASENGPNGSSSPIQSFPGETSTGTTLPQGPGGGTTSSSPSPGGAVSGPGQ